MTVDSTFKPITPCYLIGTAAVQISPKDLSGSITTYRVRCLVAAYLTWGPTNTVVAAGAPGANPSANTLGYPVGTIAYIDVPAGSFFISNTAASFEITGGQGGSGGQ